MWTAKALARLRGWAGLPEPSLVAYALSTIISWAGSFYFLCFLENNCQHSSDFTKLYSFLSIKKWAAARQNQQNDLCAQLRLWSAWALCPVISEDSDQPGHLPSLIRDFAFRLKKTWVFSYPMHSKDSDQTGQMPRLMWVFAGCTSHFAGFVGLRL